MTRVGQYGSVPPPGGVKEETDHASRVHQDFEDVRLHVTSNALGVEDGL